MLVRRRHRISSRLGRWVVLGYALLAPPAGRAADESFLEAIQGAAKEVLNLIKGQSVSLGQITPTDPPDANGGPAIVDLLKKELERIQPGVVRPRGAPFTVKGDYAFAPHPVPSERALGQKALQITFRFISTETNQGTEVPVTVLDNTSILRLFQGSGPLPLDPKKDQREQRRERNPAIVKIVQKPQTFIDPEHSSRISTSKDSPYQVEILAGPLGDGKTRPAEARPARPEDGLAFVKVERDEVYEVRVYNHSPEEVAIRVFIDGLDLFHFSDDRVPVDDRDPHSPTRPRYTYLIVPPAKAGSPGVSTAPGWHKSIKGQENFQAFLVTEYGKGASSKAGIPASGPVGVIQVQFSRCYPPLTNGQKRSPTNETGFGPPREIGQTEVAREVEPPIDVVSVRYTR